MGIWIDERKMDRKNEDELYCNLIVTNYLGVSMWNLKPWKPIIQGSMRSVYSTNTEAPLIISN